jgi:tripartite-type tricarboxylate transporter receptor subunit TctC
MIGATMIDNGYPTIEASSWFVFFLRVGTPAHILTRLARAFRTAIQDREIDAKVQRSRVKIENRVACGDCKDAAVNREWARCEDGKDRG